ncbi:MAG: hypothetical protein WAK91_10435 [Candidatus Acidiferrales bacterium]|jgi:hypothetical protein
MAIAITVQSIDASGSAVLVTGTLAFSGNYSTGGDTLDWTTADEQIAPSGATIPSATPPQLVLISSVNGNADAYIPVQGSALNNWKVKCFAAGGTEVSAGAYPSGITGDIVAFLAQFPKLQ